MYCFNSIKLTKVKVSFRWLYIKLAVITLDGKKGVHYSGLSVLGLLSSPLGGFPDDV